LIFIAICGIFFEITDGNDIMASTLNIQLTDELRRHVDMRASDNDVYATPSEYIRDLVRRDMEDWAIVTSVVQGLREVSDGEFVKESILDVLRED
jgi:antitoxin ParD1/3/4